MAWPAKANRGEGFLSVYLYAGLEPALAIVLPFDSTHGPMPDLNHSMDVISAPQRCASSKELHVTGE